MSDPTEEPKKLAHEYAWHWFEYHAGQRMTVFRFFLILTGAIAAGCFAFLQQQRYGAVIFFALLLNIFSFLFWRLDRRNRQLVQIGEAYLREEEERLADLLGTQSIRLVEIADRRQWGRPRLSSAAMSVNSKINPIVGKYFASFGQVYQWIFATVAVSGAAVLIYALAAASSCHP